MSIDVKKGGDIAHDEFPLFTETLEYFDLIMELDDFGVTYFAEHIDAARDYAVVKTDFYRELSETSRKDIRAKIRKQNIDGTQSPDELMIFIESLRVNTIEQAVFEIAEINDRGLTTAEKAEIEALIAEVEVGYERGATEGLDSLLAHTNIGRMLDSDDRFLEFPPASPEMMEKIRNVRMPAYFVLDVSYSMTDEHRIDYANDFVQRVSQFLQSQQIVDYVRCLIYWGESEFIDLFDPKRFSVGEATGTGEALRIVGEEIRARNYGIPVFLALVTDGLPNCEGEYQGSTLGPVEYTVKMASLLPDTVVFSQIAFPPLEPGDPERPETLEDFQAYLADLKRVTDVVKHGQTYVLVKQSEQHLPWIPLGAYQKAKYLTLVDQSFAVIEDV